MVIIPDVGIYNRFAGSATPYYCDLSVWLRTFVPHTYKGEDCAHAHTYITILRANERAHANIILWQRRKIRP